MQKNWLNSSKRKIVNHKRKIRKLQHQLIFSKNNFLKDITSTSVTLCVTGIVSIAKPKSNELACGLAFSINVMFELVMQK